MGGRRFARLSAPHSHTPRAHASIDARVVFATPSRFRSMSRVASFAAALASLLAFAGAASPEGTIPDVSVDVETLPAQLLELSRLSSAEPSTGVTRLIFTEDDVAARDYVKARMADAGLEIREDAMGNIFGRWVGSEPHLPAVGSGSHTDAIPQSGAYDGTLGVLGPIEAIAALRRAGFTPRRSIEALMFTSEEPTRFGISCVGSRAMAAKLDPEYLAGLSDVLTENGTFLDAAKAAGYASDAETHADMVEACAVRRGAYSAFLELHIEQGPELEREGLDLGLVTAIAAPAALRCAFEGDGGHAGAQLMPARNDALAAAAELTLAVERLAKATGAKDTVATVGVLKVGPGAVNSVPRTAEMEIDVRDVDGTRRDALVDAILREGEAIASRRNARWSSVVLNADPPARCAKSVVDATAEAATRLGLASKRMVSRAYHDSLFVAEFAPTGMLFVPCREGWSHRPDEFAEPAHIKNGVEALALALARLSLDAPLAREEPNAGGMGSTTTSDRSSEL